MTGFGGFSALAILLGWVLFHLIGLALSPLGALIWAAALSGLAVSVAWDSIVISGLVAILSPFGVMLPALALRHVATQFGVPITGFSSLEILLFLLGYIAFLSAAFGVLPIDLYRFGYAPWPVAIMVLLVCLYALVTGNWFLAGVAVAGQLAWVLGWGSSNWFDMMLHVLLVPVAVGTLIARMF